MSHQALHERLLHIVSSREISPPLERMQMPPESNALVKTLSGKPSPPPNIVPEEMLAAFTLQGDIPLLYWYFDDRNFSSSPVRNSAETYLTIFRGLDAGKFDYYHSEGKAFFSALTRYSFTDMEVTIWGLAGCNCEALAVWAGASRVIVVEYNKPVCEHPKIAVCNLKEYTELRPASDFAISYSSFEHDGLGRYGDPLMPDGDLRAMRQARDGLKDGGIMFFGVPLGPDSLVWNAHRIYGKRRLPMLLRGWKLLDVFSVHKEETPEFPFDIALGDHRRQCLMVLQKIAEDWPEDDYLLRSKKQEPNSMDSDVIFNKIIKMVFDYKHAPSRVIHE
jgi:hypothetical protein